MTTTRAMKEHPKEYRAWKAMRSRCNGTEAKYQNYRDKQITVCNDWNTFSMFLHDMGKAPTPVHSLDRIDNSKGYSKENCRWATKAEQANNRDNCKEYVIAKCNDGFQVKSQVLGSQAYLGQFKTRLEAEQFVAEKKELV